MAVVRRTFVYFLLTCSLVSFGQNLEKHSWKQRVVLILSDTKEQVDYRDQTVEFTSDIQGFTERKLVVYHVTPKAYATGTGKLQWTSSSRLYQQYKKLKTPFEVILIGLDGGIKLRQSKVLRCKDLYALIDAMPMRRSEIKNE